MFSQQTLDELRAIITDNTHEYHLHGVTETEIIITIQKLPVIKSGLNAKKMYVRNQ